MEGVSFLCFVVSIPLLEDPFSVHSFIFGFSYRCICSKICLLWILFHFWFFVSMPLLEYLFIVNIVLFFVFCIDAFARRSVYCRYCFIFRFSCRCLCSKTCLVWIVFYFCFFVFFPLSKICLVWIVFYLCFFVFIPLSKTCLVWIVFYFCVFVFIPFLEDLFSVDGVSIEVFRIISFARSSV
jgi:hypothetical protein